MDVCELWQKASSLISDVSKSADMTSNIKTLENNGERLKEKAKIMLKQLTKLIDTFYMQLEKSLETIVGQKKALLEYHALEVQQYVTHIKALCNTAQCYLQGFNVHISQYGPKLKKELELCIEQASEFNSIDYETFTSLELEANLEDLKKVSLCNIVSINKFNQEKQVLEAIYFDKSLQVDGSFSDVDVLSSETKKPQDNLINNSVAEMVVKHSISIPKPLDTNCNHTITKSEVNVSKAVVFNSSCLLAETIQSMAKTGPLLEEKKMCKVQYCKDLETENKENAVSTSSSPSSLPGKWILSIQEGSTKRSSVEQKDPAKEILSSVSTNSKNTSSLPVKWIPNVQECSTNRSSVEQKDTTTETLPSVSSNFKNTSSLPGKWIISIQEDSTKRCLVEPKNSATETLSSVSSYCKNTSSLPGKWIPNVQECSTNRSSVQQKDNGTETLSSVSSYCKNTSSLPGKWIPNVQECSTNRSSVEQKDNATETLSSVSTNLKNTSSLPGKWIPNVQEDSTKRSLAEPKNSATETLPSVSSNSKNTSSLPGKWIPNVQEDSTKRSSVEQKNPAKETLSSVCTNSKSSHGVSADHFSMKSIAEDLAACKITSKSKVTPEIVQLLSTATGDSIVMNFRSFMKTSPYSANEINAQLIRRMKDYGNGAFNHPTGLTVNKDGQLIVTDTGNNLVEVLEDKHLVFSIGDKDGVDFQRPSAVVCDKVGNIYVKDDKCIRMFNSKGNYLHTIGKGVLQNPYGLSLTEDGDDNVLVLIDVGKRAQSVYHYNIRQDMLKSYRYEPLIQYGQPTSKVRFLATYKNLLLASDLGASCMYLSTIKGEFISAFGSFGYHAGDFKEPSGVTVDCSGNWIVGDSKNNRLQIFNKDGDFLAHIKLSCPIRRPSGIHLTNDGKLFMINYLDSEILVFQLY